MDRLFDAQDVKSLLDTIGVEPSEHLIDRLSQGLESDLLENALINGAYQDGKIKLFRDKSSGTVKFSFKSRSEKLEIPEKILGHKLTDEEKKSLQALKTVLIKKGSNTFGIAIDKDLNRVVVKGDKELGLLKEVGEYKFSLKEQEALINGKEVGPKIFFDKESNQYIQASIAYTDDKKGIKFLNAKEVSFEKAQELIPKLNKEIVSSPVEALTNVGAKSLEDSKTQVKELPVGQSPVAEFMQAVGNRDYEKMEALSKNYSELQDPGQLNKIFNDPSYQSLSRAERIGVEKILGSTPEQASKSMTKGELETALGATVDLDKINSLSQNNKLSSDNIKTIEKYMKDNPSLDGKVKDGLEKVVEKEKQKQIDLSPTLQAKAISKTKSIGI